MNADGHDLLVEHLFQDAWTLCIFLIFDREMDIQPDDI